MSVNGYLVHLKTMLVTAMERAFDQEYPEEDFRRLHVSIEYPNEPQNYPGIWVSYSDTRALEIAGIDHHEFTEPGTGGSRRRYTRWKFAGFASFTCVALTSLERDRLFDEVVRILAFNREDSDVPEFRRYVEDNEFIACNFNFDQIEVQGNSVAPGTPWGTDEFIYEVTVNMEIIGEFISDASTGSLAPLRQILVKGRPVLDVINGKMDYPDEVQFPLGPNDIVLVADGQWV